MGEEASPSFRKDADASYDDGYSEGGSFSGRDSYMDEREGGMRNFDFDPVRVCDTAGAAGRKLGPASCGTSTSQARLSAD